MTSDSDPPDLEKEILRYRGEYLPKLCAGVDLPERAFVSSEGGFWTHQRITDMVNRGVLIPPRDK